MVNVRRISEKTIKSIIKSELYGEDIKLYQFYNLAGSLPK